MSFEETTLLDSGWTKQSVAFIQRSQAKAIHNDGDDDDALDETDFEVFEVPVQRLKNNLIEKQNTRSSFAVRKFSGHDKVIPLKKKPLRRLKDIGKTRWRASVVSQNLETTSPSGGVGGVFSPQASLTLRMNQRALRKPSRALKATSGEPMRQKAWATFDECLQVAKLRLAAEEVRRRQAPRSIGPNVKPPQHSWICGALAPLIWIPFCTPLQGPGIQYVRPELIRPKKKKVGGFKIDFLQLVREAVQHTRVKGEDETKESQEAAKTSGGSSQLARLREGFEIAVAEAKLAQAQAVAARKDAQSLRGALKRLRALADHHEHQLAIAAGQHKGHPVSARSLASTGHSSVRSIGSSAAFSESFTTGVRVLAIAAGQHKGHPVSARSLASTGQSSPRSIGTALSSDAEQRIAYVEQLSERREQLRQVEAEMNASLHELERQNQRLLLEFQRRAARPGPSTVSKPLNQTESREISAHAISGESGEKDGLPGIGQLALPLSSATPCSARHPAASCVSPSKGVALPRIAPGSQSAR